MLTTLKCQLNLQITSDPKGFVRNKLNHPRLSILKLFKMKYDGVNPIELSLKYIAKAVGISERHVQRCIKDLEVHGLIQKWTGSFGPNTYLIHEFITTAKFTAVLMCYFVGFFAMSNLYSVPEHVQHLTLKDSYLKKQQVPTAQSVPPKQLLYLPQVTEPWFYTSTGYQNEPNSKMPYQQFVELFGLGTFFKQTTPTSNTISTPTTFGTVVALQEKEPQQKQSESNPMISFTPEQELEIKKYPQKSMDYAIKIFTRDMAAGKEIKSQAGYFLSILRAHAAKATTPQQGQSKSFEQTESSRNAKQAHQQEEHKYLRTAENWKVGMSVLTNPSNFQPEVKFVESEMEFAINVERVLHRRMKEADFDKRAANYPNPMWDKLTKEQQANVMSEIHVDCNCRQSVDNSLAGPVDFTIVERGEGVTKRHETDWNSKILAVRTETSRPDVFVVSDNFLQQPPPFDGDFAFEEVLD